MRFFSSLSKVVEEPGWEKLTGGVVRAEALRLMDFSPIGLSRLTYKSGKLERLGIHVSVKCNAARYWPQAIGPYALI